MGNIFGNQKKNPLQPNAQPSGTQPTLTRRDAWAVCWPWRCELGGRRTVRGGVPKVTKSCKKTQTHLAPKKVTKSDTHNWNQNSYPRPLLFENKLCARRVPKHDPKMGIIFGTQNRKQNSYPRPLLFESKLCARRVSKHVPKMGTIFGTQNRNQNSYPRPLLFENKVCARRVPKHVPKMGTIFGTQNRNSLQPNAQPSAAKTGTIFGTQKKNSLQPHAQPSATQTAQTHVPNIVIFFEPKPEFVANQCAVELPRAGRKRRQNKFPTWWPLCVQTLGTHYNTMRS